MITPSSPSTSSTHITTTAAKSRPQRLPATGERIVKLVLFASMVAALVAVSGCAPPAQLAVHLLQLGLRVALAHVLPAMPAPLGQLVEVAVEIVLGCAAPEQIVLPLLRLALAWWARRPQEPGVRRC